MEIKKITVAELVAQLSKLPQDASVVLTIEGEHDVAFTNGRIVAKKDTSIPGQVEIWGWADFEENKDSQLSNEDRT